MISRNAISLIIGGLVYLFIQVLVLRDVVLFDKAFCFIYLAFLLLLPVDIGVLLLMGLGFITGFSVDLFYDSVGIHTAACVFIMFLRPFWTGMITPSGGYDPGTIPSVSNMGLQWFSIYSLPIIFLHHLLLLFIEAGGFTLFWFTLGKVILSTILTFLVIIIVQFLLYKRRRTI